MSWFRDRLGAFVSGLTLVFTVSVPATLPIAAETLRAQTFAAELMPSAALATTSTAIDSASLRLGSDLPAAIADATVPAEEAAPISVSTPARSETAALDAETTCLAKAVRHEAGNQSRKGQLAVAQLVLNRRNSGRFAESICGVINQPGQFFATAAYHPDTSSASWAESVSVAREAMSGAAPSVAPGALFFHAAFQAPRAFFRSRQRVTMLGGNIFYR